MDAKRDRWLDTAKSVAIIGVVLQHARGWAYSSDYIYRSLLFAVGLFVLLGGYNAMDSYLRRGIFRIGRRLLKILVPYIIVTFIYSLYATRTVDLPYISYKLIHFNAMAPLYYVAVHIQLTVITPVLIYLTDLCHRGSAPVRLLKCLTAWSLILVICYLTVHYTNILDIIIGGGNLFAGPWLMFHFAGICIRRCRDELDVTLSTGKTGASVLFITSVLILLWHYLFVYRDLNAGLLPIFHGDQVLITWAHVLEILLLFVWFHTASVLWPDAGTLTAVTGFLGRHSLYIFLYHVLFLEIYVEYIFSRLLYINSRLNQMVFVVFIFACPIAAEGLFGFCQERLLALLAGRRR